MISETMPLNEWPLSKLNDHYIHLAWCRVEYQKRDISTESIDEFIDVLQAAIKDVEFEQSKKS